LPTAIQSCQIHLLSKFISSQLDKPIFLQANSSILQPLFAVSNTVNNTLRFLCAKYKPCALFFDL
jgi:hypothetical protein